MRRWIWPLAAAVTFAAAAAVAQTSTPSTAKLQADLSALSAAVQQANADLTALQAALAAQPVPVPVPPTPPAPPAPPTPVASADGTTVSTAGPTLSDANGNVFALTAAGQITMNGTLQPATNGVQMLVAENGVVYQTAHNLWWGWTNGAWNIVPADPRPPAPPAPPSSGSAGAPSQAAAAGFTHQVADYEFASMPDIGNFGSGTHTWYRNPVFFSPWPSGMVTDGNGAITLETTSAAGWPFINLISNVSNTSGTNEPAQGSFLHGYFEYEAAIDDAQAGAWPALWLFSSNHFAVNNPSNWSEIDVFEGQGNTPQTGYSTIHDWANTSSNQQNNPAWPIPPGTDLSQFHKYGLLWVPGHVTWYFDDKPVLDAPTFAINDTDPVSIVLSAQANGWSGANNASVSGATQFGVHVQYVKVWQ